MKVIQVVPTCNEESSGVTYCVLSLCRAMGSLGPQIALHALEPAPAGEIGVVGVFYPRKHFPCFALGRSPEMLRGLRSACKEADIIHTNGLWMYPNVYPDSARCGTNCKFVLQPHGTLSKWALANSKWKKRLFGLWCQYSALRHADMFVATAESEYEDIRRLGYRQPVCVLPNGVDIPSDDVVRCCRTGKVGNRRRMYFLSRIHPKKNVDLLLRVWSRLEGKFPDWDLSIVGPDRSNSYADEMKRLAAMLGCKRVSFEGEINGKLKQEFVAQSDCIVLPTFSENFGMVIAEALALEVPAICSYGAPWEGLNTEKCGWWVPTEDEAFERAMSEAMSMSREDLRVLGRRGRKWMQRDFAWDAIGAKMNAAYEWLLDSATIQRPEWVKVD